MKTSSPLFLLSSLFLLAFFPLHGTAQNLIRTTCKTCSQQDLNVPYNFCTTSLLAALGSRCASLRGLGMISIRLTRYNLTDTRCYIKYLMKNNETNTFVRAGLNDCFELYSDAIPSIKQAMKCYNAKRYVDGNVEISSVIDAATTCEYGFKERKGIVSPLTKNDTFKLSTMVLSNSHVLQRRLGLSSVIQLL